MVINDLGTYLIANAPSDTPIAEGTNLYYGMMPEDVQEPCVALLDGAGSAPESPSEVSDIQHPGARVLVRGAFGGYVAAYNLIETVVDVLHLIANQTIGGTRYIQVRKLNEPRCVGFDEHNRPIFSCDMAVMQSR